MDVIVIEGKP